MVTKNNDPILYVESIKGSKSGAAQTLVEKPAHHCLHAHDPSDGKIDDSFATGID
jgi:hypothetical protein